MWEKTLNKHWTALLIGGCAWLTSVLPLHAFPEYTSRENAIRLANVINRGEFKTFQINSVFVKSRTETEYYLQALLDDGSTRDWKMDRIYEWTLTDQLRLPGNQALVFPSEESTEFVVLDKNVFHREALQARVYTKVFEEHDILEGRSIKLAISRFRMLQPGEESRFATDARGNRYRYVIELENGMREVLTYPMAYRLLEIGALSPEVLPGDRIHSKTFKVREMVAIPRQTEDELRSIYRFGVEVFFDRPMSLRPEMFPFQVVEQSMRDPETGQRRNQYYLQVSIPNSEKLREIPGFRSLEYLRYVELVTDVEHQKRVFLRAQVNPDILELPPYIEVTDRNSIVVSFYTVTDQSVARRQQLIDTPTALNVPRSVIPTSGEETEFERFYLQAVEQIRAAQRQADEHLKISTYISALDTLQDASVRATNDAQLTQSLKQRDVLLKVLPGMVVENAQRQILEKTQDGILPESLRQELNQHLEYVERYTSDGQILRKIETLRNILR
jgi:hypothetical protein